jgi:uncharacterized protein YkwD
MDPGTCFRMRSNSPRLLMLSVTLGLLVVTSGCLGAFGGGGSDGTPDASTDRPAATDTPTPTPENGSANGTAGTTATTGSGTASVSPTASRTSTPTPAPEYDLNPTELEDAVRERVDARRAEAGYEGLTRTRTGNLSAMAQEYSAELAAAGYLIHDAGGETTRDRYERYALRDRCRITNNADKGVVPTSELEVLGIVALGQNQTIDGTTYVATNETTAAEVLVTQWYDNSQSRRALMLADARHLGIGITIEDGRVYVVGEVC